MINKKEIRKKLNERFNPRLASVSDLNEVRGDRFKQHSAYNHENMDLIDITEGAIYNTWKELVDCYDIFVFDSEESKKIDDYEYGKNDGYTCNFLVVEYDEHEIVTQYFIWNGYSNITKELLVILEQVK
ncbi:hypothetical protein JN09_000093 [Acholeplasma morum]|uniref:hypothetical protein n=1 Tax=Paracholeplasma morum TaxID=264637 RepID=UPI00195A1505|nr:hypothetical protein [Paracholeplasma morum]MBM7452787.1 hypothetical protein [Paracholeplasma morum]